MSFRPTLPTMPALVMLIACAGRTATPAADVAQTSPVASPAASVGRIVWTGALQPTPQRTGDLGPTGTTRAYGNVELSVDPGSPNRTRARMDLTVPTASTTLTWAVLPGRCGSNALPLVGVELFPTIEIGSTGRGSLDAEVPMTLPTTGAFHVNIYWRGQQLSDVMTCANLRRKGT